jgi:hypothetical protein
MTIVLQGNVWKAMLEILPAELQADQTKQHRWGISEGDKVKTDISAFDEDTLTKLYEFLDKRSNDRRMVLVRNQVKQWMLIRRDPTSCKVPKLINLIPTLTIYMEMVAPNRYLFRQNPDGNFVPFFVSGMEFHEARKDSPAYVTISLLDLETSRGDTSRRHSGDGISFHSIDIRGRNVQEILQDKGWYIETDAMMEAYFAEVQRFNELKARDGLQLNVTGKGKNTKGWYDSAWRPLERNGEPSRMVIDSFVGEVGKTSCECALWAKTLSDGKGGTQFKTGSGDEEDGQAEDAPIFQIPVHPYMSLFDLETHEFYSVHVNNVSIYQYDTKVGEKLVLPDEVKDLLEILIEQAHCTFSDIVSGKAGGAIILCQGVPGTGKTLTAEVYSEVMQRPLYKVQSSQLGIGVAQLEERLKAVLQRAEKWGAILLIDEADVYVRARGNEIEQNAIVGVFLRVLEYYRGVLFMTTNRGTEIDDAIVSRMTARITYEMPCKEDARSIWTILARQNGLSLSADDIETLVTDKPDLSGRDIKNLLKLSKMVANRRKKAVNAALILKLAKFKQ